MRIRPCIDIHNGKVKQIVGSTLHDMAGSADDVHQNFVSVQDAGYYASLYRKMNLPGGHIILLNSVHDKAAYEADLAQAKKALQAFPGGMQIGGGITPETAGSFLDMGASHVIVTSYVFRDGQLDIERLQKIISTAGKERLVLDLSCKAVQEGTHAESVRKHYYVVTDRWQKMTKLEITPQTLDFLADQCDEFLIHAADVEGRRKGIEKELVKLLGSWQQKSHFPITYAGGVHSLEDLDILRKLSGGQMDVTVGSALKLFGGDLELEELVKRAAH